MKSLNLTLALVVITMFAIFASGLDQFLFFAIGLRPLFLQLLAIAALLGVILARLIAHHRIEFTPKVFSFLIATFILMLWVAISVLWSSFSNSALQALILQGSGLIFILTLTVALHDKESQGLTGVAAAVLAIFGSVICIFDFIQPTYTSVPGRGAGWYFNSNEAGFLLVGLGLIASFRLSRIANIFFWSVISIAVALTFSRTGWATLSLSLLILTFQNRFGGGRARFLFVGIVILLFAVLLTTYLSGDLYYFFARSSLAEYLDPNTLARLGGSGSAFDDYSSFEREDVFRAGLDAFFKNPILGHGVGYTSEWVQPVGPHNMYILLLAEQGIIGLILMIILFVFMTRSAGIRYVSLSVLIIIYAATTHNLFMTFSNGCLIAFAASQLSVSRKRSNNPAIIPVHGLLTR